jgi:tRNA(Ile)-lysidine synthase
VTTGPVIQALDQNKDALSAAPGLFVGFSGGLDSTVLLHAVSQLRPDVVALHANHALQDQATAWDAFCEERCRSSGIAFLSATLKVRQSGEGLESAAREARYRWFESLLQADDLLLLAHHQDDQAETLLLRLLRGAGPDGLTAMPRRRSLGQGALLRPLLDVPRSALEAYAEQHALAWIDDPSNADVTFDRNYLRHTVMPLLEQRWPGYRKTFARSAFQLADWLEHSQGPQLDTIFSAMGDPGFAVEALPRSSAAAALALRSWLRQRDLPAPTAARLAEFLRQLREGQGARLQTPDWILERYRNAVFCRRPNAAGAEPIMVAPESQVQWGSLGTVSFSVSATVDTPTFFLRRRQGGERLLTSAGYHKDLKQVFQERGVPPWWRDKLPLLFRRGDGEDELLAVAGVASSASAEALGLTIVWRRAEICRK